MDTYTQKSEALAAIKENTMVYKNLNDALKSDADIINEAFNKIYEDSEHEYRDLEVGDARYTDFLPYSFTQSHIFMNHLLKTCEENGMTDYFGADAIKQHAYEVMIDKNELDYLEEGAELNNNLIERFNNQSEVLSLLEQYKEQIQLREKYKEILPDKTELSSVIVEYELKKEVLSEKIESVALKIEGQPQHSFFQRAMTKRSEYKEIQQVKKELHQKYKELQKDAKVLDKEYATYLKDYESYRDAVPNEIDQKISNYFFQIKNGIPPCPTNTNDLHNYVDDLRKSMQESGKISNTYQTALELKRVKDMSASEKRDYIQGVDSKLEFDVARYLEREMDTLKKENKLSISERKEYYSDKARAEKKDHQKKPDRDR